MRYAMQMGAVHMLRHVTVDENMERNWLATPDLAMYACAQQVMLATKSANVNRGLLLTQKAEVYLGLEREERQPCEDGQGLAHACVASARAEQLCDERDGVQYVHRCTSTLNVTRRQQKHSHNAMVPLSAHAKSSMPDPAVAHE
jgi:hypothetical protein